MKTDHTNHEKSKYSYAGLGIVFGASLGFIFALLFSKENIAVGIGIGVALGLIVGASIDNRGEKEN